ncbi:MAG: hypothetical protein LBT02_03320 [Rickettsiales bacterium]|jgi:hypothetical protein|nr:hypothetical protein [Rickettsiales bacterium]
MRYFLLFFFISFGIYAEVLDGIYYDWSVFTLTKSGEEKKCYTVSFPHKKLGNYKKNREPYILVTRFQEKKIEEVSIYSGFEYKIASNVYISVDGQQFAFKTKEDVAWTKTKEEDKKIIEIFLDSMGIKVRAESAKLEYIVDEYSLKGFVRAYKRIRELCK